MRLKANITFLPVRSAWSLMTRITARTRSSNGQLGPSDCSSSSLMKSMPASQSCLTSAAVASASRPTLGLMMVPISGPAVDAREPARARDAETRAGIGCLAKAGRQADVEQAQPADLLQLEQVAGNGRDEVRQGRAERRQRPRQGHERARDALAVPLALPADGRERCGDVLVEDVERRRRGRPTAP